MILPAQNTRNILPALALCLVIVVSANSAAAQDAVAERKGASSIRGVVVYSDTGHPVRHSAVEMIADGTGQFYPETMTDGHGRFVLGGVPAGRYLIFAVAPGLLSPDNFEQNMGSVSAQLRLNEIRDIFTEVVVNGTDSVDVKVQAVRGGVITGRVVAEDDQPVADANIRLLKRENNKWVPVAFTWRVTGSDRKDLQTDASGVYRIAGLPSGDYIVRVSEPSIGYDKSAHDDQAYSNGSQMMVYYPAATTIKEAQPVTVIEGSESSGVDVRLPDRIPRTISGSVTLGAEERTVSYAEVYIARTDERPLVASVMDATTTGDREGKWELRGVPAGEYVVTVKGAVSIGKGYVYVAPKNFRITVANEDVVVNANLTVGAIVKGKVKFDGPAPEDQYLLSPGVVLAQDGSERPVNSQDAAKRDYSHSYVSEGGFEIRELAAGKYWFVMPRFKADQFYVKSVTRKGLDLGQNSFKLEPGAVFDDIVVTLGSDLATIEGNLADPKTKTSASDTVIMLAPANDATRRFSPGLLTSHPDAHGKFVFSCGPGEYFITALSRSDREKLKTAIAGDYFTKENSKLVRVKVRAGEKLKGVTVPLGVN
jgi:hypothetical protein